MSRLGKKPIFIPEGVKVSLNGNRIEIEGKNGKLDYQFHPWMKIEIKDNQIHIRRASDSKRDKALHGLTRSLINNMVLGVSKGYQKELEIIGIGYRAQVKEKVLNLHLGFSHPITFSIPEGIAIETPKPTQIIIKAVDKAKLGEVAAKIRSFYPPEPYKGKGIRYKGEYVRHKIGKAVA